MKLLVVPLAVLFGASVLSAQSTTPAAPAAPAATGATAKPAAKKKEEEAKIPGVTIPRPNGTFLGLEVVGTQFKLSFYDKKKKAMMPDVARATAVWPNRRSGTPTEFRTVLNLSGKALVGAKPVLPPLIFTVRLVLLQGDGDDAQAVENYAVQFNG